MSPASADPGPQRDRERLEEIRMELIEVSRLSLGYNYANFEHRDRLEREAAEIRERLGVEDSRPPLSTGSTRLGWTVLTLSVVVVVFTLAVLANI
ncbi:hypothetical protein [Microbacterium sp. 77mftsu3.1]|uniref:hypothetical protein n=1 Tax=Microbacterium sp. 77mftsu3.1 TaxID=1761802 RepID=UPI0008903DBD|nr:hypothetical protein [Microbacterium sp. 77mftsu3.1]SDG62986.1 hypothetical protein SAMN04488590_1359 [Microbacterium sp. 77mftsu3.1]